MTFSIRILALLCFYCTHALAVYAQRVPLPSPGPSDAILLSEGWLCRTVAMPEHPDRNITHIPLPERWSCFFDDAVVPNRPHFPFRVYRMVGPFGNINSSPLPKGWRCRRNNPDPDIIGIDRHSGLKTVVLPEGWRCGGNDLLVPPEGWRCDGSNTLLPPGYPDSDVAVISFDEGLPWRCLSR